MKQFILTFILVVLSCSMVSSKLKSTKDMKMLNKVSQEVKDFKSNMHELDSEEKAEKSSILDNSSEILNIVKSLQENFADYKKASEEEKESKNSESPKTLFSQHEDYLYEISTLTSDISQTVSTLLKVDKNDEKREKINEKIKKIQEKKQKFKEARENLEYLRNLKNNNLLNENKEKTKMVMAKLISIYDEYISIEDNLKNNLSSNLSEIQENFKKSDNLISNFNFFSTLLEKMEKFFSVLEESKTNQEDKEKLQKFKKFIEQTNQLDRLNKNLNSKIESEITKIKKISNQSDRLKSLNKLLKVSNALKSLNLKVLQLKDDVCNKMRNSLESNLDKIADLIKNSNTDEEKKI
jgi:hypothetical protein